MKGFPANQTFRKKCKNAKIFGRISQTFSRNFAKTKRREKYAKMRNIWCLLVVLKSIFIFYVNPSIWLAEKSLWVLYSQNLDFFDEFSLKFCIFLIHFFVKFSGFFCIIYIFFRKTDWRNLRKKAKIFAFFASERNTKMKRNGREKIFPFHWKPYIRRIFFKFKNLEVPVFHCSIDVFKLRKQNSQ